ncbi:MAG: hypothetical protein HY908_34620 [Myxococcales bacterium]|nr:hypothetical protein [Myxococcales bacterium]
MATWGLLVTGCAAYAPLLRGERAAGDGFPCEGIHVARKDSDGVLSVATHDCKVVAEWFAQTRAKPWVVEAELGHYRHPIGWHPTLGYFQELGSHDVLLTFDRWIVALHDRAGFEAGFGPIRQDADWMLEFARGGQGVPLENWGDLHDFFGGADELTSLEAQLARDGIPRWDQAASKTPYSLATHGALLRSYLTLWLQSAFSGEGRLRQQLLDRRPKLGTHLYDSWDVEHDHTSEALDHLLELVSLESLFVEGGRLPFVNTAALPRLALTFDRVPAGAGAKRANWHVAWFLASAHGAEIRSSLFAELDRRESQALSGGLVATAALLEATRLRLRPPVTFHESVPSNWSMDVGFTGADLSGVNPSWVLHVSAGVPHLVVDGALTQRTSHQVTEPGAPEADAQALAEARSVYAEIDTIDREIGAQRVLAGAAPDAPTSVVGFSCDKGNTNCVARWQGGGESGSAYVRRTEAEQAIAELQARRAPLVARLAALDRAARDASRPKTTTVTGSKTVAFYRGRVQLSFRQGGEIHDEIIKGNDKSNIEAFARQALDTTARDRIAEIVATHRGKIAALTAEALARASRPAATRTPSAAERALEDRAQAWLVRPDDHVQDFVDALAEM